MRLWTVHPQYLDARGLVALWREGLLARKVLLGKTVGYRRHSQLQRFYKQRSPVAAINAYLLAVWEESQKRGYVFDRTKIAGRRARARIAETRGQLQYEWQHLSRKLQKRDPARLAAQKGVRSPRPHPLFRIVAGPVRDWERVDAAAGKGKAKKLRW